MMLSRARLLEISEPASHYFSLLLEAPDPAAKAAPGQFMHIRIRESLDPFLRRPFSIACTSPEEGTITILFRVTGVGTGILSRMQPGEYLDCLGPLGSGFNLPKDSAFSALVAGGAGIAPLLFLARRLAEDQKVALFYGASSKNELVPVEKFLHPGQIAIYRATEDGGTGFRGRVTGLFEEFLKNGLKPDEIFACGPPAMLRTLTEKNQVWNRPLQLSLEERMACGIGACRGCAVKTTNGKETGYRTVCRDGPVFYSHEVVW